MSGNGKTTLARKSARKLGVAHVELDRLNHLPGWTEASDEQFRASVDEATRGDGWVTCGSYENKLGTFLYDRADEVVWLDQPLPLVLFRLIRRAVIDVVTRRDLFNGNRQTWKFAFWGRDSLVGFAIRMYFQRRKSWPPKPSNPDTRVTRLRSPAAVERWFASL